MAKGNDLTVEYCEHMAAAAAESAEGYRAGKYGQWYGADELGQQIRSCQDACVMWLRQADTLREAALIRPDGAAL